METGTENKHETENIEANANKRDRKGCEGEMEEHGRTL